MYVCCVLLMKDTVISNVNHGPRLICKNLMPIHDAKQ